MGACLPDYQTLQAMGFLSPAVTEKNFNRLLLGSNLVGETRKQIRIVDEQEAVHRYIWRGLPKGLYSELIERILYYRYKGMFFELNGSGYFLPVALTNGIDCYGRFRDGKPLPFTGSTEAKNEAQEEFLPGISFPLLYDAPEEAAPGAGVLCYDYCLQMTQSGLTRQSLQEPTIELLAQIITYIRTAIKNSTGVRGMRIQDQSEQSNVTEACRLFNDAALRGDPLIPIVSTLEIQEIMDGDASKPDQLFMAYQALNNYRLSLYGLENGGVFQKDTTYQNTAQTEMNTASGTAPLYDGLMQRQRACEIANAAFGWSMSVEINPYTAEKQQDPEDEEPEESIEEDIVDVE